MIRFVATLPPAPPVPQREIARPTAGEAATEETVFRGGEFGLAYAEAKHEGEAEALAAGARLGVEVVQGDLRERGSSAKKLR